MRRHVACMMALLLVVSCAACSNAKADAGGNWQSGSMAAYAGLDNPAIAYLNPNASDNTKFAFVMPESNVENGYLVIAVEDPKRDFVTGWNWGAEPGGDSMAVGVAKPLFVRLAMPDMVLDCYEAVPKDKHEPKVELNREGNWYLTEDGTTVVKYEFEDTAGEMREFQFGLMSEYRSMQPLRDQSYAYEIMDWLVAHVNIYHLAEEGNFTSVLDWQGNRVDLSDYYFMEDLMADAVAPYGVQLRDPLKINSNMPYTIAYAETNYQRYSGRNDYEIVLAGDEEWQGREPFQMIGEADCDFSFTHCGITYFARFDGTEDDSYEEMCAQYRYDCQINGEMLSIRQIVPARENYTEEQLQQKLIDDLLLPE